MPLYFFEHNRHLKFECKFCAKALDFETVSKDLYAFQNMYYPKGSLPQWACKECFEKLNTKHKWPVEEYDWRIDGNESYLIGKTLKTVDVLAFYTSTKKEWDEKDPKEWHDHNHCCFCWEKFMIETADKNPFAYCTDDDEYWICKTCYNDFKKKFKWK